MSDMQKNADYWKYLATKQEISDKTYFEFSDIG